MTTASYGVSRARRPDLGTAALRRTTGGTGAAHRRDGKGRGRRRRGRRARQDLIADNGGNQIVRLDPETGLVTTIAEGMPAAASLVFGEGEFDNQALYVTSTFRGGGKIWKVSVGVRGATLHR